VSVGIDTAAPERTDGRRFSRPELLAALEASILELRAADAPFVVGINGINAAGKTTFADAFHDHLAAAGHAVQVVRTDDFHHPRGYRYATGHNGPAFFERYIDFDRLVGEVLRPIRREGRLRTGLRLLDVPTDGYTWRTFSVEPTSIVLVEGIFLYQDHLLPYFDLPLYLEISSSTSIARGKRRWTHLPPDEVERRFRRKYLPGQAIYLAKCRPRAVADVLVDNQFPAAPVVTAWRPSKAPEAWS
jgi:uridine kinase